MADILIRGMEMPGHCFNCSTKINPDERRCNIDGHVFEETLSKLTSRRDDDCPLVELPPHGDLIEAEHLAETLDYYIREAGWGDEINEALRWVRDEFIKSETVIVPASEEVADGNEP